MKRGYDFFHQDPSYRFDYPHLESVVRYYETRAPEQLADLPRSQPVAPSCRFDAVGYRSPGYLDE